jgi:hypothetical protein
MKKIAFLGGVAAFSLIASAAAADSVSGHWAGQNGNSYNPASLQGIGTAIGIGLGVTSGISVVGGVDGNAGTAEGTQTNTFTLTGNVSKDCSFYATNASKSINLGTIGIQTGANVGQNAAFDMVDDVDVLVLTSVAGCNTKNTVKLSKVNLTNAAAVAGGYDDDEFTNVLPTAVSAAWTGVEVGQTNSSLKTLTLAANSNGPATKQQGAWKSGMAININVPAPTKSLLAGTYTGSVTVELAADL